MAVLNLAPLRELQDRDMRRLALEQQLKAAPRDIAAIEAKITTEKQAIETAKTEWRELEAKKKLLETEIQGTEQKIAKYRTQQLEVRKNDEYRALTHEIETAQTTVGGFEEEELKIMFSIDEARKRFTAAEAGLKTNISGYEGKIRTLQAHEKELQTEVQAAVAAVEAARPAVPEDQLKLYDRLARKPGHPVCVPVSGGRCGGCHMKVSANVEFEARKGENIVTCDQCSRMVYFQF
jgi:predicted  nucleic acid-binding Zn-ribbon protein